MVAPITLNIRHIRGHTFTVEIDYDADTLGLKVVIWESEHIAIEQQRLIFGGKELIEGKKLCDLGITEGSQIFLVEANVDDASFNVSEMALSNSEATVSAAVVPPAFSPENEMNVAPAPAQSGSFAVQMPAPQANANGYELVSEEESSNERINSVIALEKYVRIYCIFMFFITLGITFFYCYYGGIVSLFYLLGWIGARKLNRCLLIFPIIVSFLIAFGGLAYYVFVAVEYDIFEYGWYVAVYVFHIFLSILHIMIFLSICKLCCRIGKLQRDEWCNARARIMTKGCCC